MVSTASFASRQTSRPRVALVGLGAAPLFTILTAVLLGLALVAGGGTTQGLWSDAVVQIGCLALAGLLPFVARPPFSATERWAFAIVAAAVALPIIQLVPLPPGIWAFLPGRVSIEAAYREAGIGSPWLPISLDPGATLRSVLSLIPPIVVFSATLALGAPARRTLVLVALSIGLISVVLGMTQVADGPSSPLRFYAITNPGSSVGFFANVNHQAAFLYCLVPLTAAWIVGFLQERTPLRTPGLIAGLILYSALLLGLATALSRAGVILAIGAAVASLAIAARNDQRLGNRGLAAVAAAIVIGGVVVAQFASFKVVAQFDENPLGDMRFQIAATTLAAGQTFQPTGSGFGTFVPVYQMFEAPADMTRSYVNHAHDDWLEVWLEGGWPGVAIVAGFLAWFGVASLRLWRSETARGRVLDRAIAQAASITILLLLLHSVVDYPLRTTALSTLFAFCCALLVPAPRPVSGGREDEDEAPPGGRVRRSRSHAGPMAAVHSARAAGGD